MEGPVLAVLSGYQWPSGAIILGWHHLGSCHRGTFGTLTWYFGMSRRVEQEKCRVITFQYYSAVSLTGVPRPTPCTSESFDSCFKAFTGWQ